MGKRTVPQNIIRGYKSQSLTENTVLEQLIQVARFLNKITKKKKKKKKDNFEYLLTLSILLKEEFFFSTFELQNWGTINYLFWNVKWRIFFFF